jgi:hypothetical protein
LRLRAIALTLRAAVHSLRSSGKDAPSGARDRLKPVTYGYVRYVRVIAGKPLPSIKSISFLKVALQRAYVAASFSQEMQNGKRLD